MEGRGRLIGGLALVLMGVLGVCLTCGLPMWRETSFVGANIVTAQSVWDGLWLHCIMQSTGQMQCKRHTQTITNTADLQAGRALTLISILAALLGFIITLLGGGVVNCSDDPPDPLEPPNTTPSAKKACVLGGALCVLAGVLVLISVSWSAGLTVSLYNDPFVAAPLKREVGTSIYIGWASSVLLLLGGALICFVCGEKKRTPPSNYTYMPYTTNSQYSDAASTLRSDVMGPNKMYDRRTPSRKLEYVPPVYGHNSLNKPYSGRYNQLQGTQPGSQQGTFGRNPSNRSGTPDKGKGLFIGMNPNPVRDIPSRATTLPPEYYESVP
ncbi:claudin-4-like [Centropristis striata]|uniref:claudin-4-like n=1 Tax=Centropristis striata TaxID=184440 RepID=UPI0027DF2065|nr:claudin-4-like [Centropristis striata]